MRVALALALVLSSCAAAAADPWLGAYVGSATSSSRDCTTGESLGAPETLAGTLTVERSPSGLFIADGGCFYMLEELTARSSSVVPSSCETTSTDGTPVHIEIVSGAAVLEGTQLSFQVAIDLMTPGRCVTSSSSFVGIRR